jgi:putative membrane protein
MGPGHFWWGGMWGFPWMMIMIVVIIALCFFFVCRGVHRPWGSCHGGWGYDHKNPPAETPLEILKRRYAAGEINKEGFQQMKKDLDL